MTNQYLKAIHADDPAEQFQAFRQFLEDEMEATLERMPESDFEEMTQEERDKWSYEKGRLDYIRTVHGMVVQVLLAQELYDDDGE